MIIINLLDKYIVWFKKNWSQIPAVLFFPSLSWESNHKRKIPVILQMNQVECGVACLTMILNYYKHQTTLEELRNQCGAGRDGLSAQVIASVARQRGMQVKAFSIKNLADFGSINLPAIVHWHFNHYVVVEQWTSNKIQIVDPASGRRRVSLQEFSNCFTGVALTFEPTSQLNQRQKLRENPFWREYLGGVLKNLGLNKIVFQIIGASLLLQFIGLALPMITKILVDQVLPLQMKSIMPMLGIAIALMALVQGLTSFLRVRLLIHLQSRLDIQLVLGFFNHVLKLPFRFFQQRSSGDLLMRLSSNYTIREILTNQSLSTFLDGVFVLSYLVIIFYNSIGFGLIVLLFIALQLILLLSTTSKMHTLMQRDLEAQSSSQSYLVEALKGIIYLKATGAETRAFQKWSNLFYKQFNISIQRNQLSAILGSIQNTLQIFFPLALFWIGTLYVLNNTISLGAMLALCAIANSLLSPVASLVTSGQQLQLVGAHLERIADVIKTDQEQISPENEIIKFSGQIELKHVSYKYEMGPYIIDDISLNILPGQKVAIVGVTGSGKTTLAMLLLGLFKLSEGQILYDNIPLETLNFQLLRNQFGVVLQDPFLFSGSIRQNIFFNKPKASLEEVIVASQLANIHDEIIQMPMAYETIISEGGTTLSGGQRQRISLARALLSKPSILILDEATSHLDVISEKKIDQNLASLDCTRIVIAHRLSTVYNADLICVLDKGKIIESGKHDALLAQGGFYASLLQSQMREN